MSEKNLDVVPHKHCVVCGKAIGSEEIYCSTECEKEMIKSRKKQRNFTVAMMALFFALLLLMFLIPNR
ncbi:MAG: DUF2116 family Zn-ribbon domain-containing protein [Archaeoglobaceae archaeon]